MKNIKLIVFDVDGVLTDGTIFLGTNGQEFKAFHTQDGMGISLAHYCGIKTAIITGRKSDAVLTRAKELKINYLYQGIHNKIDSLSEILNDLNISHDEVCYIGDDINDLPIINKVGYSAAPNNAVNIVKNNVDFVSTLNGGNGAVRDILDHLLSSQYDYNQLIDDYLEGKVFIIQ